MASSNRQKFSECAGFCCSICLDQFRDPRSLACLHTFCEECIHDFVTKQQADGTIRNGIECPLCRKVSRVKDANVPPKLWSKIMPINYALQDAIETLTRDEQLKEKDKSLLCNVHGKQIEFFCTNEKLFCCSTCAINKLKEGKEVSEIKEIARKANLEKCQPLQRKIYDLIKDLNNLKRFLNKKEIELDTQINMIDLELKMIQDKLVEKLEHSRALIMSEATSFRDITFKHLKQQRKIVERMSESLEKDKEEFDDAVQNNTPERMFITLQKIEDKVRTAQASIAKELTKICFLDIKLNIDKMVHVVLDENLIRLGEVTPKKIALDSRQLIDYRKVKLKKVAVLDILLSNYDEKQPLYSGMDFFPDGRLALVDNANWRLIILSKQLHVVGKHKFSSHVFDIAVSTDYELFITGAKRLETILIESERGFARVQTTKLESCPFSISFMDKDRFVIGTYRSSKPVRILSKSGTEMDFAKTVFPEKQWKIDDSRCAFNPNDRLLVLTDRYENSVYIYDASINNEIRVKDERIVEPRGVAFGPFGCIFVCSRGTNSIVQLSRYGEVLGEHTLDMMYPCTICFSKDNKKVAVTNSYADAKQLQIFQISDSE